MLGIYSVGIHLYHLLIIAVSPFNKKANAFIQGRKDWQRKLESFQKHKKIIWFHCASVGEFEQARPVIEKLASAKLFQIVLTFFSPSGYELRKNYPVADLVMYLPLDTPSNSSFFVKTLRPDIAIFVKYDFWFNLIDQLAFNKIPSFVISAYIPKNHWLMKFPGIMMRNQLLSISNWFVQDQETLKNLTRLGFKNIEEVGDTRIDRVLEGKKDNSSVSMFNSFIDASQVLVIGSNWKSDDALLIPFVQSHPNLKVFVAPHELNHLQLETWKNAFKSNIIALSEITDYRSLSKFQIVLIDKIGLLSSLYSLADLAYVGGGFGKAVHNTLEAAVFRIPVLFGPKNQRFLEIQELKNLGIGFEIKNLNELNTSYSLVMDDENTRKNISLYAKEYFNNKKGASNSIVDSVINRLVQ